MNLRKQIRRELKALANNTTAAGPVHWEKGERIIVNLHTKSDPEYFIGTVTSIRQGKVYVEFDDGDTGNYKETSPKLLKGNKKKRKSEIPESKLVNYLAEDSTDEPKLKGKKTAKEKKPRTVKPAERARKVKPSSTVSPRIGGIKEMEVRFDESIQGVPGRKYGKIRINGKDWRVMAKFSPTTSKGYIEQLRFKEGDIIARTGGSPKIVAEAKVERIGKGKFRHGVARYNFAKGGWQRDMFDVNNPRRNLLLKTGEADPTEESQKLKERRTTRRKHLDERNKSGGEFLKRLVDEGILSQGMMVRYPTGDKRRLGTATGFIRGFNFDTGRILVQDEWTGKKKSVQQVIVDGRKWGWYTR